MRWTARDLLPLRVVATRVPRTFAGLGTLAIGTSRQHRASPRYGAIIDLDGDSAMLAGLIDIALGAVSLALSCRAPRAGAIHAGASALAFVVVFAFAPYRWGAVAQRLDVPESVRRPEARLYDICDMQAPSGAPLRERLPRGRVARNRVPAHDLAWPDAVRAAARSRTA